MMLPLTAFSSCSPGNVTHGSPSTPVPFLLRYAAVIGDVCSSLLRGSPRQLAGGVERIRERQGQQPGVCFAVESGRFFWQVA